MTQEDRELLYKDLAARQPYRPFICFAGKVTMPFLDVIASAGSNELMAINGLNPDDVKVYLRPMESMTEEEYKELKSISSYYGFAPYEYICDWCPNYEMIEWLNAHHFDYRGLIKRGLALEAPEDMYKF